MTARAASLAMLALLALGAAWLAPRLGAPPDRLSTALGLLEDGRAEDAGYLFSDPSWRGVAQYRAGRYFRALGEFVQEETVRNLYNMGNAYAQLHEWAGAKAAYNKALSLDPDHEDATHNLAVVLRAEAREREILDEQRTTRRMGRWRDGNREGEPETGPGTADKTEQGGAGEGELRAAKTKSPIAGQSDRPGEPGGKRLARNARSGVSEGRSEEDAAAVPEGGAGRAAALRESRQDAELLLRRITDNPRQVLAARLKAAHRGRREEAGQ